MHSLISNALIGAIKAGPKPYEIRDTRLTGLLLRVQPSGVATYYIEFSRGRRMKIGRADVITAQMARDKAKELIGEAYQGNDPIVAKKYGRDHTFDTFLEKVYRPWAEANLKNPAATLARLRADFYELLPKKLAEITPWHIEKWRASAIKRGLKASTINRSMNDLSACLNRAAEWEVLSENPTTKIKPLRVDTNPIVRFLSDEEEQRLRAALINRDDEISAVFRLNCLLLIFLQIHRAVVGKLINPSLQIGTTYSG